MKRQMKASAVALLISGCLLALSAGAAGNDKGKGNDKPGQCAFDCTSRTNKTMETCTQACPVTQDPNKKEAAGKCLARCADRFHSSMESCSSSCPKPAPTAPPQESSKTPAPSQTPAPKQAP